jgi:ABC-2 type transport system ATP-binding protein
MPPALEFDHISKQYRGWFGRNPVCALDDFSLCVEPGEIFGFLGPNGAGKTTAIHLAMGFMHPTRGSGHMLGCRFGDARTRSRVGFLAESVALYHRPVVKLVRLYGALNGIRDPQLRQRTREVLEALELTSVADRNSGKLSHGMIQRVGLAQALVNDPELLLLDEPTSAVDPPARIAVRELLLRMRAAGKTIFISSHQLSEIELISDRVAILQGGRIRRVGRTRDLLESRERLQVVARSIATDAFQGATAVDGTVTFNVLASEQRATIERVWSLGGEIVSLNPVRKSLEEVFVDATQDSGERSFP